MSALPKQVTDAGTTREKVLDVRPVLEKGGDPFTLILRTAQKLADDEALHLVVGFEPAPLYEVMKTFGREAHTEHEGEVVHVWFFTPPGHKPEQAIAAERAPLKEPVELDVRGLEPPGPLMAILEKLVELGPGAQLLVRHHREPVLLYEKLRLRGYDARAEKLSDGEYRIRVAPVWAFQG